LKTSSLPPANSTAHLLPMDVLQQFRLIFGSMRQYFRLVEERCGMSGSQMWVLQEVQRTPEIGIGELATRLGVHQSTCSLLVDKLVASGCLIKKRQTADQRRVGLCLDASGLAALAALPGPAEGILPEALSKLPVVSLKTLHINLEELILHLPGKDESCAGTPLSELVASPDGRGKSA
jgi:DNA-binding MarR family transcriptional regulator